MKKQATNAPNKYSKTRLIQLSSKANVGVFFGLKSSAQLSFSLLLVLALTTSSWRYGKFSWLSQERVPIIGGGPVNFGVFNLLPLVTLIAWFSFRVLATKWQFRRKAKWQWGRIGVPALLFCLSILGLKSRPVGVPPWVAVIIIGLFDTTLWLTSNWQSAIIFAIIAA